MCVLYVDQPTFLFTTICNTDNLDQMAGTFQRYFRFLIATVKMLLYLKVSLDDIKLVTNDTTTYNIQINKSNGPRNISKNIRKLEL